MYIPMRLNLVMDILHYMAAKEVENMNKVEEKKQLKELKRKEKENLMN